MHCADKTAITSAVSAISITDSTYVKISQEEEVDECITFPEEEVNKSIIFPKVEKVFSARETAVYNAPICLDHFFQSDPIFKMNMLINTSTHI